MADGENKRWIDRVARVLERLNEANLRIQKLETALREIAALGFWDGDSAMSIASKALDAK